MKKGLILIFSIFVACNAFADDAPDASGIDDTDSFSVKPDSCRKFQYIHTPASHIDYVDCC